MAGQTALDMDGKDKNGATNGDHLPAYLLAAREVVKGSGATNDARVKAFRKAMNDNVVQTLGLQNHIRFAEP